MEVSHKILEMYESYEGFSPTPYKDTAGVWTIGIGSTITPEGRSVRASTPEIDYETAKHWKKVHIQERTIPAMQRGLKGIHLTQFEIDAISSLVYNCGAGCLSYKWARALQDAQGGEQRKVYSIADKKRIVDSWMSICKDAKGNTLVGLKRRRMTEIIYFFTGELHYYVSGSYAKEQALYKDYDKHSGLFVYQKLDLL